MSENTQNNPTSNGASAPNSQPIVETNFLNGTETSKESLYADLFTKNENNEIVRKQNSKRSILEIVTIVLGIAMPIALTLAVLGGVHAFIKGQEDNSSIENFQFLCGYIRSGVNTDDPAYECQTPSYITKDVEEKTAKLKKDIVEQLSFYIPLKLSTSANTISKEKEKAEEIYGKKISVNEIIEQFNKIRRIAQSPGLENIICSSLSISDNNNLSVQCSVYGWDIGSNDSGGLGSSRIEAIRFLERLGNTPNSQFIVTTPPTILSVESTEKQENISPIYKTKTTVTISMTFLPKYSQL